MIHRLSVRFGGMGRFLSGSRWMPMYAVLRQVGRRSGTAYATPVVAFRAGDGFLIPLPFGDETQWLLNVQAAERAGLRRGGREYVVAAPEVVTLAEAGQHLPVVIRWAAGAFGIARFVRVQRVDGATAAA